MCRQSVLGNRSHFHGTPPFLYASLRCVPDRHQPKASHRHQERIARIGFELLVELLTRSAKLLKGGTISAEEFNPEYYDLAWNCCLDATVSRGTGGKEFLFRTFADNLFRGGKVSFAYRKVRANPYVIG